MFWQITTFLALTALVLVHLSWARRLRASERAARAQVDALARSEEAARIQAQVQQEAVFDSMVEGVVLLDREGRIQLANRQFAELFGLAKDSRGQTLMEATRMHELAELVAGLSAAQPVQEGELRPPGLAESWLEVNAAAIFDEAQSRRGTVVRHAKFNHPVISQAPMDGHRAPVVPVFDRVIHQIAEHLPHPVGIGLRRQFRQFVHNADVPGTGARLEILHQFCQQRS